MLPPLRRVVCAVAVVLLLRRQTRMLDLLGALSDLHWRVQNHLLLLGLLLVDGDLLALLVQLV